MGKAGIQSFDSAQAQLICTDPRSDLDVAQEWGVSRATISRIRNGHTYASETLPVRNIRATALKIEKHNERIEKYFKKIDREFELRDRLIRDSENNPYVVAQKEERKRKEEELNKYRELLGR
jgi:hypothetical protein